ncbi:MAG: flagellar basal body rod protein FlgB [Acidobacteria bacterium]|nr:flagellar basal body rod protein FlgB [Acidobacteriota bacterium]
MDPQLDSVTGLLQKFLDVQTRRSEVIASNIANADTPGYKAKQLEFDEFLREAVRTSEQPLRAASNPVGPEMSVVEQDSDVVGMDGNTVDAGREMADLAQAGSNFNFGARMLQSRFRLLRTAIREGK